MATKVICCHNNKGGVGKTTMTVLFASMLAYDFKQKVLVFDTDQSQNNILDQRQTELEEYQAALSLMGTPSENSVQNYLRLRIQDNLANGLGPDSFFAVEPIKPEVLIRADLTNTEYDYIFIDLGAKVEEYYLELLNKLDLLLIPCAYKNYELRSTLQFIQQICNEKRKGNIPEKLVVRAFWNKVNPFSKAHCNVAEDQVKEDLAGVDVSFYKSRILTAESGFSEKKLITTIAHPFAALEESDRSVLVNPGTKKEELKDREYMVRIYELLEEFAQTLFDLDNRN